jgi:uncharacterized protein involved in outer membrane biogenesis
VSAAVEQRRLLAWVAGTVAVLVIVVLVALEIVDLITARAIERRGSAMTGTAVHVDGVDLSLLRGTATARGLTVANPSGFAAPNAFELGEVHVDLVVASLFGDLLMIHELRIGAPNVFLELDAAGRSNVEVIRDAVEEAARREKLSRAEQSGDAAMAAPTASTTPPAAAPRRRVIIELLTFSEGQLHLDARAAGGPQAAEKLPGFELTGIGARQGGATPAEAGRIVIAALARDVTLAVAASQMERYLGKDIGGPLGEALKRGGAEVIERGFGELLDELMRK